MILLVSKFHVCLSPLFSVISTGLGVTGTRNADQSSGTMDADLVQGTMDIDILSASTDLSDLCSISEISDVSLTLR